MPQDVVRLVRLSIVSLITPMEVAIAKLVVPEPFLKTKADKMFAVNKKQPFI